MRAPRPQGAAVVTRGCLGLWCIVFLVAAVWVVGVAAAKTVHAGALDLAHAIDGNPDPKIFETTIVARSAELDLTGEGKPTKVETYNGRIPGPKIRVKVGDQVVVTFKNKLSAPSSIHWHGIEVNNASDGTAVSQDPVIPGESFVYRFQVTRPGIFWYHPHIKPTNQVFKGLYGSFIVTDDSDEKLTALGVLPNRTRTLVLSDITICKAKGENDTETFPADDTLPWVGGPSFDGHSVSPTPRDLCEEPIDQDGEEIGKALPAGAVPNIQPAWNCRMFPGGCRVNEGQIVLVNGRQPARRAGSPSAPGPLAPGADPLKMKSGEALRLQVINAAASRYFRLRLTDQTGNTLPLYRIGGEGGLLNRVRLEGGLQGQLVTKYDRGQVLLAPANRSDIVLVVPPAKRGDVLTLWTEDYAHTGFGFAMLPTVPLLHIRVVGTVEASNRFKIKKGMALLVDPRIDKRIETLRGLPVQKLLDPADFAVPLPGTDKRKIRFTQPGPSIDGIRGSFEGGLAGGFKSVPHIGSSRFARVGDLLILKVTNQTQAHHPFHLHGFSFQPIRIMSGKETLYRYRYREFVDTVDVQPTHSLVFRVRLDDRKMADGSSLGGAVGRWLFHCHIFHHASLGKISELVVLPAVGSVMGGIDEYLTDAICRAPRSSGLSASFPGQGLLADESVFDWIAERLSLAAALTEP
jgi:FtsP/CotA-like multicopper oxidase with cupredoxin domain